MVTTYLFESHGGGTVDAVDDSDGEGPVGHCPTNTGLQPIIFQVGVKGPEM